MTGFEVAKWGHPAPLADGICHCGRPIKYNLREGVVGHVDPDVNAACAEPWPDAPAPERYAASRAFTASLKRGSEALDRALGLEPRHAAGRQRTDEELMAAFGDLRFDFWMCPVDEHSDSRTEDGVPVETVHWVGNVAHCTWPDCGRTSADPPRTTCSVSATSARPEETR